MVVCLVFLLLTFLQTAIGLKNFMTAPFRATKQIFTRPSSSLSSNVGSASLTASKLRSAVSGEKGGWKEVVRDWWRLFTMNPERQKEAERIARRAAIEGEGAARAVMRSDSRSAEAFGQSLRRTWEVEQYKKQLEEESKSEDQLDREFNELISKGH